MIVERILAKSAGIFFRIYHHPFNQQLSQGTLPRDTFIIFLKQDAAYLRGFSVALKEIAKRFDDRRLAQQFKWFSEEMVDSEKKLQSRYLSPRSLSFYTKQHPPTPIIPVISNYTAYQLNMAKYAPIEEAVSCLASCYWIYQKMGETMSLDNHDSNPYQAWIKSYSGKQFSTATHLMMNTLQEIGMPITCHQLQKNMIHSFYQSAQYELMFYDAILPQIKKLPNDPLRGTKIKEPLVLITSTLR